MEPPPNSPFRCFRSGLAAVDRKLHARLILGGRRGAYDAEKHPGLNKQGKGRKGFGRKNIEQIIQQNGFIQNVPSQAGD